jgi:hypothetical protein
MGVMGWVTVNPDSDYAKLTAPIQKAKTELGAENFVNWNIVRSGKAKNRELAEAIAEAAPIDGIKKTSYVQGLSIFALTGFAAACLQPGYCKLFKGMSKGDLDRILDSFSFRNCVVNESYRRTLVKNLA